MPADQAVLQAKGKGIAKALATIGRIRKRPFSIDSKSGRFEVQKTVYLLRRLGHPSALKFSYNIYLNGPYSPELAEVYYALGDDGLRADGVDREVSEARAKVILDALGKGPDFLEALTTVLDGERQLGNFAPSITWAKSIKPHLPDAIWVEVRRFLAANKSLTGST